MQELAKFQKALTVEKVSASLYTPELKEQLAKLTEQLAKPCTTEEEKAVLDNVIKQAKAAIKVANDARMPNTRLIDSFKNVFMDAEKQLLAPVNAAVAAAASAVNKFVQEQFKAQQERQRQIDEELAAKTRRMSNPDNIAKKEAEAEQLKAQVAAPVGVRMVWEFEVTDPNAIPRQFLQLNEAAVKAAINAGKRDIPGLNIKQVPYRSGR